MEARREPLRAVAVNVLGTANALEAAVRLGARRFVYASSAAVYGGLEPPLREDLEPRPLGLYGETKLAGERLLWGYSREYGLSVVALRYFNVYGPGMRPGPYSGVVLRFVEALLSGGEPVVYGDGLQTRDFVYVGDVAEANLRALESRYVGPVNVGTGRETSILELYRLLCRITRPKGGCPEPRFEPSRPGDVRRSAASTELAKRELGWRARTSLEEGLRKTVEYYRRGRMAGSP